MSHVKAVSKGERKQGLLLVPEFPHDSFWSYHYVMRLIGRKAAFPPLGMLTFAALMPEEWDLSLVDLNVMRPSERTLRERMAGADAVFVSAMSIQKRSLVALLEGPARGLEVPFVLGGPLASSYRGQIMAPASPSDQLLHDGLDVLVWGEASGALDQLLAHLGAYPRHRAGPPELLLPPVVAAAEPGTRRDLNDREIFRPLEPKRPPRWDLVRVKDYQSLMIQTTAGCPFRCDFCDIVQFNGGFTRPKPPALVRQELEAILATGYRGSVFTVDDNFVGLPAATIAILDEMIEFQRRHEYPFTFYTQASVNLGTPALAPLLERMRQAGFEAVFLGIENPDPAALRAMNKKQNLKVDIPAAIAAIQNAGIEVYGGFILGGEADGPGIAGSIVEFVKRNRIFTAMAGMLTPVPYTPLYERLKAEGRLLPTEYTGNNTDDDIQFRPHALSPAQLRASIHEVLQGLFATSEAYRRALDTVAAVRNHLFNRRRLRPGYLKAGVVSAWQLGIRRLNPQYFQLLWRAARLDRQLARRCRAQAHELHKLWRQWRRSWPTVLPHERAKLEEMLALAREYAVRFRREHPLPAIESWFQGAEARVSNGLLTTEEVRRLYRDARRHLRARWLRHRFPGVKLTRAIEAAVKALHYESVMRAIVAATPGERNR